MTFQITTPNGGSDSLNFKNFGGTSIGSITATDGSGLQIQPTGSNTLQVVGTKWDNNTGGVEIINSSSSVGAALTLLPSASSVGPNGWSVYAGASGAAIGDGSIGFWNHTTFSTTQNSNPATGSGGAPKWWLNGSGQMRVPNQPACLIACQSNDITWSTNSVINYGGTSGSNNVSTKVFDQYNSYNFSNGRFTAPITGTYFISATVNGQTGNVPRAAIRVNGTVFGNSNGIHFRGNSTLTAGGDLDQKTMSIVLQLNTGDYVDFYCYQGTFDTFHANYFCAYMVG